MRARVDAADVTLAILAGGAATRLDGRDKGLERIDGQPLIAHVLGALRAHARNALIVANRNMDAYDTWARTIADVGADGRFLGPLAGISAALDACTTSWVMTAPVDCPSPPFDLAPRLLQSASVIGADAFVAHDGERRQPLFALYRATLAPSARNALAAGQGVWQWQTAIAAKEVDFSDRRQQFVNLNTPEDFTSHAARSRTDA